MKMTIDDVAHAIVLLSFAYLYVYTSLLLVEEHGKLLVILELQPENG